jgi:hypothetical protein
MNVRTARRSIAIAALVLLAALWFASRWRFALIQIDDEELIARWAEDRKTLNSLVVRASQGALGDARDSIPVRASESQSEIERLRMSLNSRYPGSEYSVEFDEHWNEARISVRGKHRADTWDVKGYVYLPEPPPEGLLGSDLNSTVGTRRDEIYYRRLDGHWYIFLSRW